MSALASHVHCLVMWNWSQNQVFQTNTTERNQTILLDRANLNPMAVDFMQILNHFFIELAVELHWHCRMLSLDGKWQLLKTHKTLLVVACTTFQHSLHHLAVDSKFQCLCSFQSCLQKKWWQVEPSHNGNISATHVRIALFANNQVAYKVWTRKTDSLSLQNPNLTLLVSLSAHPSRHDQVLTLL